MKNSIFIALLGVGMLIVSSAQAYTYQFINKCNEPIDVQYSVGIGESPTTISIPAGKHKIETIDGWKIGLCFDLSRFQVQTIVNNIAAWTMPLFIDEFAFNELVRTNNSMSAYQLKQGGNIRDPGQVLGVGCGNIDFVITRTSDFVPVVFVLGKY